VALVLLVLVTAAFCETELLLVWSVTVATIEIPLDGIVDVSVVFTTYDVPGVCMVPDASMVKAICDSCVFDGVEEDLPPHEPNKPITAAKNNSLFICIFYIFKYLLQK
jgi:hypothetical protein